MKDEKIDKILDKLAENDFFNSREIALTPGEIALLRNNPQLLNKLADSTLIKKRYIYIVFSISMLMMISSKIIQYTGLVNRAEVLNDILTNVLFSVSMEMLGACIIAYMLEIMFERRMRKNRELIAAIRKGMK